MQFDCWPDWRRRFCRKSYFPAPASDKMLRKHEELEVDYPCCCFSYRQWQWQQLQWSTLRCARKISFINHFHNAIFFFVNTALLSSTELNARGTIKRAIGLITSDYEIFKKNSNNTRLALLTGGHEMRVATFGPVMDFTSSSKNFWIVQISSDFHAHTFSRLNQSF
jgi:hypothetical protein